MRNFTTEDFSGCGQYLVRAEDNEHIDNTGYLTTIMKKVGYTNSRNSIKNFPKKENLILLTDMSDGLTYMGYYDERNDPTYKDSIRRINSESWIWVQFNGLQSLCDYLNNPDLCLQEHRFATQEEVVRVAKYQKSRCK